MEWRGTHGEVLYGFHVAATLRNWTLSPDEASPDASVITADAADVDPFWSAYEPTAIRLLIGQRWWIYSTGITALSDTLYGVSGTPEVKAL